MLIWLVLGVIIAAKAHPALPVMPAVRGGLAFLSILMASIIALSFIFLDRGSRWAYYLTLAIFIFTAILTIFDNVGLADIIVLVLNIIPIVLLILGRTWFLHTSIPKMQSDNTT
jgi:hypothetical protein